MDIIYQIMDAVLPASLFQYTFMKNALLALLLLTPLLALLSFCIFERRGPVDPGRADGCLNQERIA